ncbi:MAG: TonB-dependent receptor [Daejeonella sp.]
MKMSLKYAFAYKRRLLKSVLLGLSLVFMLGHAKAAGSDISLTDHASKSAEIIRGIVKDSEGLPLPGVSIKLKETTKGTITNINGEFEIDAPLNAVLVVSFLGFETQEVRVDDYNPINIVLKTDSQSLQEVVVVGYGTQKKSVVTGAISSVKGSELENQQIPRLEQALQGRTSGITIANSSGIPGAESTVRIRGNTSLNGNASEPLYVVDGIVVSIGINYLNPSDIESIEVLKDAASAAIYGARSSAGVILVTTKKGKEGAIKLNYNSYFGMQTPANRLDLLNATQYATLINEQAFNDGLAKTYANPEAFGQGTDWQDVIFSNAGIQNHELSISGGSDKSTFFTSFGFFDQDGIVAKEISNYKRYNVRLNSTHKIKKWFTIGESIGYLRTRNDDGVTANNNVSGPLASAINLDPITPIIVTDPAMAATVPYSNQPVIRDKNGNPYGISQTVQQNITNPLANIRTNDGNFSLADKLVGNVFTDLQPLKYLRFRSTIGVNASFWGGDNFTPIYYLTPTANSTQTSFSRNRFQAFNWNLENTLSYQRSLKEHNFEILLGQGAYSDNNNTGIKVTYFNLPVSTFEDASLNYGTSPSDRIADGSENISHRVSSLFSRLTYNYNEKYLFTGIIRRDGSSRFGQNNRFGYFPSGSLGWVVTRENFWQPNKKINFLKLRGSYGITGNDVLGDFRYISTVGTDRNYTFGDNLLIGYSPDAPANPNLKWEQTSQLNIGLDATLFENFNLTLDWYTKKTKGILQVVDFPNYAGATGNAYGNVADMENRGLELELGYQKRFNEFNIELNGNASYLRNRVTYLGQDKAYLEGGTGIAAVSFPITRTAVGHAIDSFYGYKSNGIFQNTGEISNYKNAKGELMQPLAQPGDFRWEDINGDGTITVDDRDFIGDPTPDWSYGLSLNASFKNFDFLAFGQGVIGNQIYQAVRKFEIFATNWQTNALGRWNGDGTSNTYPRLSVKDPNKNFSNPSNFFLQKGDYFRIKTLQVGYTVSKARLQKMGIQRARIYISSNNLLTLTKYTGYDPEIGGNLYSIDKGIYPQSKSFLFGLNFGI